MSGSLRPHILLLKSKVKSNIAPSALSSNTMLALIIASFLNGKDSLTFGRDLLLSVSSMLAIAFSVYVYNDLTDIEIDRSNKLYERPLVAEEVSEEDARNLVMLLAITGLTIGFIINLEVFLLQLTFLILGFLYSSSFIHLKGKFLCKNLTISTGATISYLVGGATVGNIPSSVFYLAAYGFVASMSISLLKDLRDLKGDKIHKIKTLPLVWGPQLTIRLSIALVCAMAAATVVGYSQLGFNMAFPILASCAFAAWIYVTYPLFRHWNDPSYVYNTIVKKLAPIGFSLQILIVLGALL